MPDLVPVTAEQRTLRQKRERVTTVMPQGSVRTQEPHAYLKRPRTDRRGDWGYFCSRSFPVSKSAGPNWDGGTKLHVLTTCFPPHQTDCCQNIAICATSI